MRNIKLMIKAVSSELKPAVTETLGFVIFSIFAIGIIVLIEYFGWLEIVALILLLAIGLIFVVFLLSAFALKLSKIYSLFQDLKQKDDDINKAVMDADDRELWG